MSEENKVSDQVQEEVSQEQKVSESVSKKAYEDVSRDMHKFKEKMKAAEQKAAEYESQLKLQEESKLHEQEKYKELFEKRDAELEQVRSEVQQERSKFAQSVKASALKQELGGLIKDQYLKFAELDAIAVNDDGTIDAESLRNVANEFRKEHGPLIPSNESASVTGHAASSGEAAKPLGIGQMSRKQLLDRAKQLKSK